MTRLLSILAVLVPLTLAAPALAQERELCPTRPGLGTPPCVVDPGHVLVELGLADWTREQDKDTRTDTILSGDLLLRYGLGSSTEVQVGWTALGHVRERDRMTGMIDRHTRTGDVLLGLTQNLSHPDGKGFSIAVRPFVTLPVGGKDVGAGDWGTGVILPVSYEVSDAVALQFTGEVDGAPDEDGDGRHLAYSGTWGLGLSATDAIDVTAEIQVERDRDPQDPATMALAALSIAWQPSKDLQLDIGGAAGLNHASPDVRLYGGVSRRF